MGETTLLVRSNDLAVNIEVNTVNCGTIHPTRIVSVTAASDALMADQELPLLSPEEIYGGSSSPLWIASTPVTCSTGRSCSSTAASHRRSGGHLWCTSPATPGRYTKSCFRSPRTSAFPHPDVPATRVPTPSLEILHGICMQAYNAGNWLEFEIVSRSPGDTSTQAYG